MRLALVAAGWAWAAAIVWLSLTPAPPKADFAHSDKLGHLAAYGVLMLWFAALYPKRRARIAYAVGFVAMGITLELLQGHLGYRTFELLLRFSAKEALYKAIDPFVQRYVGFLEVAIKRGADARLGVTELAETDLQQLTAEGEWREVGGHLLTAFAARRAGAS